MLVGVCVMKQLGRLPYSFLHCTLTWELWCFHGLCLENIGFLWHRILTYLTQHFHFFKS